jgi:HK97 gp10 family phage protein
MPKGRVTHVGTRSALNAMLMSQNGAVAKDLFRRGKNVEAKAKKNLARHPRRIDTGTLRSSISTQLLSLGGKPAVRVGTNVYYALFVHDGTGIYGPHGMPIVPRTAKVLMWRTKGGKKIFALKVKGMEPNPFLKDAVNAARD